MGKNWENRHRTAKPIPGPRQKNWAREWRSAIYRAIPLGVLLLMSIFFGSVGPDDFSRNYAACDGNVVGEFADTLEDWRQAATVEAKLRRELQDENAKLRALLRAARESRATDYAPLGWPGAVDRLLEKE